MAAKKGSGKKFGTVIIKCGGLSCRHEFQDRTYGKDNRVANIMGKGTGDSKVVNVRCTICLKQHTYRLEKEDPRKPGEDGSGEGGEMQGGGKRIKAGKPKDDKRDAKAQKGRNG
jgi:hypothetical protein